MTEKIKVNTYAQSLKVAVAELNRRRSENGFDPDRRYILFVPDKYTLLAEKLLYSGGGSFDSEVLTINRLCHKLDDCEGTGTVKPLSRLGAVLTVRKILSENASKFKCFGGSAQYPDFGEMVYDNICQLASCGLHACDLPECDGSVTAYKLQDLKLVYEKYEQAVKDRYVDASGRLFELADRLPKSGYFKGASVFFACYDAFTPLSSRIVKLICERSDYSFIAAADCKLSAPQSVEDYVATGKADELKAAAERICLLASRGVSYDDMCVILPQPDYNRLKRIFAEYEIPYFTDVKYALSSHPLSRYIYDLFTAAQTPTNENIVKLSKSPYSGIARDDADIFENYIKLLGLADGCVKYKFTVSPQSADLTGKLDTAERVRRRLNTLIDGIKASYTGEEFCRAVLSAIPSGEAEITAQFPTAILNPLKEITTAVTVLADVFTSKTSFSVLCDALRESFTLKEVGVIPKGSNLVEVGDVSAFRASEREYTFILGFAEGDLPRVRRDEGLLSDRDLSAAQISGAVIEPTVAELNERAEKELVSVISSSRHLFLSRTEGSNPSPLLRRIMQACAKSGARVKVNGRIAERERLIAMGQTMFGKLLPPTDGVNEAAASLMDEVSQQSQIGADLILDESCALDDVERAAMELMYGCIGRSQLQVGDFDEAAAELKRLCPTRSAAQELFYTGMGEIAVGGFGYGFEPELSAALGESYSKSEFGGVISNAPSVYGSSISISKVQEYFACPLRCYFKYGLKLTPPPDGKVSALDVGRFLHRVIELFVRDYGYCDAAANIPQIAERVLKDDPYILGGASEAFVTRLIAEAVNVSKTVAYQIRSGNFVPEFTEARFGSGGVFAGGEIKLRGGSVGLEGVIDRVDVYGNAARVIDYKTGSAKFNVADLYYGKKIQLPVYLSVLKANGYTPVGMFYFPFAQEFDTSPDFYRLSGMLNSDWAADMDNRLRIPEYSSDVIAAKSLKSTTADCPQVRKSASCVDGEILDAMCLYALKVLESGANDMMSGFCAPTPLVSGRRSECDYCQMKAVCRVLGGVRSYRTKQSVKAEFVAECVKAEVKNER